VKDSVEDEMKGTMQRRIIILTDKKNENRSKSKNPLNLMNRMEECREDA
jgi:hypothetical protein